MNNIPCSNRFKERCFCQTIDRKYTVIQCGRRVIIDFLQETAASVDCNSSKPPDTFEISCLILSFPHLEKFQPCTCTLRMRRVVICYIPQAGKQQLKQMRLFEAKVKTPREKSHYSWCTRRLRVESSLTYFLFPGFVTPPVQDGQLLCCCWAEDSPERFSGFMI